MSAVITATISAAQLDTVDPALNAFLAECGDKVGRYLEVIDDMEQAGREMRVAFSRMGGRMSALSLAFVAIAQSAQKTGNTLELSVPAFEEMPRVPDFHQLANPRAPIPDRIRRGFDRGRGRR